MGSGCGDAQKSEMVCQLHKTNKEIVIRGGALTTAFLEVAPSKDDDDIPLKKLLTRIQDTMERWFQNDGTQKYQGTIFFQNACQRPRVSCSHPISLSTALKDIIDVPLPGRCSNKHVVDQLARMHWDPLKSGDRVEGDYKGKWYPGKCSGESDPKKKRTPTPRRRPGPRRTRRGTAFD